jgi:hypothetical protein
MPDKDGHAIPRGRIGNIVPLAIIVLLSPILIPVLAIIGIVWFLVLISLHIAVLLFWAPRSRRLLFVYSDSPNWKTYIEQRILPRLPKSAVILNWSTRSSWSRWSLAVWLFNAHAGQREFNPIAIVCRPFRRTKKFRLWRAFRDHKNGQSEVLEGLVRDLFREIAG